MAEWQTIDTAPKSDMILGVGKDGHVRLIGWHYHKDFKCWAYMGLGGWFKHNPTHWQPLPSPPIAAAPKLAGEVSGE